MTRKFFFVRKSRTEREKNVGNTPKRFEKYIIYHIALYQCMKTTAYTFNMIFGHLQPKGAKKTFQLWTLSNFELQKFAARTSGQMILFVLSVYIYVPNLKNKYHHNSTKQLLVIQFLSTQNHEKFWNLGFSSPKEKTKTSPSTSVDGTKALGISRTFVKRSSVMMPVPFSSMARKMPSNLNRWLNQGTRPGGVVTWN